MPVLHADSSLDTVGRYHRLSASQANQYRACPRLWFYEKIYKFKMPQIPVLFVGRAVEEAICRVLRDSPALVSASAPTDAIGASPYSEDGLPIDPSQQAWPASQLLPFSYKQRPIDIDALEQWALRRCEIHLPPALEKVRILWETDERRSGDWSEVDEADCLNMVIQGIRFHLEQVKQCYQQEGGPLFAQWRSGTRPIWPAPDGFPAPSFQHRHPLAEDGNISWTEAWEIARPWFVDPDAPPFSMNAIHPSFWFQGEYDLVYRWNGRPTIVDLKASQGAGDRSGDYVDQMKMYAMLWYVTHGREEHVSGLEIWYLKSSIIKSIEVPSLEDILELELKLEEMWRHLRLNTHSLETCPPEPSPLRGFLAGGVPTSPPRERRCDSCDWKLVCPGGRGTDRKRVESSYQLPGATQRVPIQSIADLHPRSTVRGVFVDVGIAIEGRAQTMLLRQGTHHAQVHILSSVDGDGNATVQVEPKRGLPVIIKDAVFTINWKGEIVLKIDPFGAVIGDTDPTLQSSDLLSIQARYNTGGTVVYRYEKTGRSKAGKNWSRKGLMLMDTTGAMKIEAWADDWNPQYEMVEVGDVVIVSNLGLDAWAAETRGDYTRNSRLQIIERVTRSST